MGVVQNQVSPARRQPDIEDYIDMVRRYRSWIVGPMFAGLVIATVIAFLWPDTFISRATMRIKSQVISEKMIPAVAQNRMSERLNSLTAEILSRDSLSEIIQKPSLDLYKKERTSMPMADVVENIMLKAIRITPVQESSGAGRRITSQFFVTFQYVDRFKAQMVVRDLVSRFTDRNVTLLKNQQTVATNFFEDEKKTAKDRMDKLDLEITKFKMTHQGQLPEHLQANSSAIATLHMQIMNQNGQLNQLQQEKMLLETNLKTQERSKVFEESRLQQTETLPGQTPVSVRNEQLANLDKSIAAVRADLAGKSRRMGAKHPDVLLVEASLASLEQQKAMALERQDPPPAASGPVTRTYTDPNALKAIQELNNQLETTRVQVATKQMRIDEVGRSIQQFEKQLAAYQARLDAAPASDQQYAGLLQEYNLAKAKYEDASKQRETADTALNLSEHQGGEQLEELESPNLPNVAASPKRELWAGMGVFAGLLVGLALAAVKEVKDTSLKNLKDVRAYTNLPVLSSIPLLENALLIRRKRRLVWLAWTTAILIGCVLMSASVFYRMSSGSGA